MFCQDLRLQKPGDKRPNTIELTSWLVHVLCDFKATGHQETSVSLEYTMKAHLADLFNFLVRSLPLSLRYSLGMFIFVIHFPKFIVEGKISSGTYVTKKKIIPSSRNTSTIKISRVFAENIGTKLSA